RPPLPTIALCRMLLPVPDRTATPAWPLKAIRLLAAETVQPTRLPSLRIITPLPALPRAVVPLRVVPMRLPWITFLVDEVLPALAISTPLPRLPEIRLPAPAAWPPTVLFEAERMVTPLLPLATASVPLGLVPTRLRWTRSPLAASMVMPSRVLPEMTLLAAAVVPPMVLLEAALRTM